MGELSDICYSIISNRMVRIGMTLWDIIAHIDGVRVKVQILLDIYWINPDD